VIDDPLFAGAVHDTTADPFPGTADTFVGATGVPTVTEALAADGGPVPLAFVAATVNVYAVPLVSPVTVWVVAVELNATGAWRADPIHGVTTYVVIGTGAATGGCHDTTACALPGVTVPMVGGGSATHADNPNATNATTTTAIAHRSGLNDRVIVSPPIPGLRTVLRGQNSPLRSTRQHPFHRGRMVDASSRR
jgi:hypothetical protein